MLECPSNAIHKSARLCKFFPEGRELDGVRGRGVGSANEIADRRLRELGNPAQSRQRRCGNAPLPPRHGDRLDAELLAELFLGQTDAAPRSAQSPPHSAALVGAQPGC